MLYALIRTVKVVCAVNEPLCSCILREEMQLDLIDLALDVPVVIAPS